MPRRISVKYQNDAWRPFYATWKILGDQPGKINPLGAYLVNLISGTASEREKSSYDPTRTRELVG